MNPATQGGVEGGGGGASVARASALRPLHFQAFATTVQRLQVLARPLLTGRMVVAEAEVRAINLIEVRGSPWVAYICQDLRERKERRCGAPVAPRAC